MTEVLPRNRVHEVIPGESIYEIAFRYGLDYRRLAAYNNISSDCLLRVGQKIILREKKITPLPKAIALADKCSATLSSPVEFDQSKSRLDNAPWLWPAKGKIVNVYTPLQKGIDISGIKGTPVLAAREGTVVYSGCGLRRYGNLIIIKHNHMYFSAYAHNSQVFVKEGEHVQRGQKIAEMGDSGTNKIKLHFEIRKEGRPINPLPLLHS